MYIFNCLIFDPLYVNSLTFVLYVYPFIYESLTIPYDRFLLCNITVTLCKNLMLEYTIRQTLHLPLPLYYLYFLLSLF